MWSPNFSASRNTEYFNMLPDSINPSPLVFYTRAIKWDPSERWYIAVTQGPANGAGTAGCKRGHLRFSLRWVLHGVQEPGKPSSAEISVRGQSLSLQHIFCFMCYRSSPRLTHVIITSFQAWEQFSKLFEEETIRNASRDLELLLGTRYNTFRYNMLRLNALKLDFNLSTYCILQHFLMMSIAIVVRTFISRCCGQHVFLKLWNYVVNHLLLNIALNKISEPRYPFW